MKNVQKTYMLKPTYNWFIPPFGEWEENRCFPPLDTSGISRRVGAAGSEVQTQRCHT